MRSSSGTYNWLAEEREGTEKEKPLPARIDLARERARVSISDWTEERGRSFTSRHVDERDREERVMGFRAEDVPAASEAVARVLRVERIAESGFRSFLKGRVSDSESESGSVCRRFFFLSAISRETGGSFE